MNSEKEKGTGGGNFQYVARKCLLIAHFFYLLPGLVSAQQLPLIKYDTKDGLGHSIVYFTTQTRDGALWFSTDNGLTRYDGKTFINYTAKDGLEANFIFGLLETDTALLISSFGAGIASYKHGEGIRINNFKNNVLYPVTIQRNRAGLWAIDRNRFVYKFTPDGFECLNPNRNDPRIFKMTEMSSGEILAATRIGVYQIEPQQGLFKKVRIKGLPDKSYECYTILEIPGGNFLVATFHAIYKVSLRDKVAHRVLEGNFDYLKECLFQDNEGNIWIGNGRGELWIFSPDLKHRELLMEGVVINHFFQDDLNNIWLSTYGQGVWCIPSIHVKYYQAPTGMRVTDLMFDEDLRKPFIASPNVEVTMLHEGSLQRADILYPVFKPDRIQTMLHFESTSEYVVGTPSISAQVFRGTKEIEDSINVGGTVASLYKSSSGEYWAGLRTGLAKIDSSFQKAERQVLFKERFVRSISEDFNGNIMAGTDRGLYIAKDDTWEILDRNNGLPNNYINVVFKDTTNQCHWIGTNEGICKLVDGRTIVNFEHPLVKYRCNSIVNDRNGIVWMATNQGLLMHDAGNFYLYNEEDGLSSDIYKVDYDRVDDNLYVLASDNLTVIETEPFLKQQSPVIHSAIIHELLADGIPIPDTAEVFTFTAPPKYLTLRFSVPHYRNTEGWQVCYRIDENPWSVTQNFSEVNLHDLPFGKFNISVKVTDANKRESSVTLLRVNNPAPIHRKLWFQVLSSTFALFLVAFITKSIIDWRNRKKELQFKKEQQRMKLEQKVLRLQMNPHFLFNSLMAIQNFIYKNEPAEAGRYLSEFAKLTRLILENSRQEFITLEKEIETLKYYLDLQQLRFMKKFEYEINIDDAIEPEFVRVPPMLSQPFIENSLEHGIIHSSDSGNIRINYRLDKDKILFTVEDNGVGFDESTRQKKNKEHRSLATTITLERLARFYSWKTEFAALSFTDVKDSAGAVNGTRVSFYIPIQDNYIRSYKKDR